MKNKLFFILLLAASYFVSAQTYDTIIGRSPDYYYAQWYDTCAYQMDTVRAHKNCLIWWTPYYHYKWVARRDSCGDTIWVKGLACLVQKDTFKDCKPTQWYYRDYSSHYPEYMYLGQFDLKNLYFSCSDSIRWDTAQRKLMRLPKNTDTSYGFEECWVYEAMFDHPRKVYGDYAIACSQYNNFEYPLFEGRPNLNCSMKRLSMRYCIERADYNSYNFISLDTSVQGTYGIFTPGSWTPFFLIVNRSWLLTTLSADSTMGVAVGGGTRSDSAYVEITAVPERGYRFLRWNDGNTDNPRTVRILSDTTFTAYFEPKELYRVFAGTSYPLCTTGGSGLYYDEEVATLTASPSRNMRFVRWSDGNTDNPRYLVVDRDTAFLAEFQMLNAQGIDPVNPPMFSIVPNPALDAFTLTVDQQHLHSTAVLRDEAGSELLRIAIATPSTTINIRQFPRGIYFLTLYSPSGTSTQKIVFD